MALEWQRGSYKFAMSSVAKRLCSINRTLLCFLLSSLVGIICFLLIYGSKVLDVTYVDWIRNATGDLAQSYYGWLFFRRSEWHFPFGLTDGIAYPGLTSIIYVDAVPWFEVFFKAISPLLPDTFQYFGLWGVTCFALNAGIGGLIIFNLTKRIGYSTVISLFFALTTFSIQRLFTHTSLAANWVILLALYAAISGRRQRVSPQQLIKWAVIFIIATGVNIYYLPIIGFVLLYYSVYRSIKTRSAAILSLLGTAIAATLVSFYLLGGFYNLNATNTDLGSSIPSGYLSANLNSFLNPLEYGGYLMGWSSTLKTKPTVFAGQYEGYAYLGLGLIVLIITTFALSFSQLSKSRRWLNTHRLETVLGALLFGSLVTIAILPTITVNAKILVSIPVSGVIKKLFDVFRSNGRFLWGAWDMILIVSATVVGRTSLKVFRITLAILCLLLQTYDLKGMLLNRHAIYSTQQSAHEWTLDTDSFSEVFMGKSHIAFMAPGWGLNQQRYYDFAQIALDNNMTINDFYYSRRADKSIETEKESLRSELSADNARSDTAYIFSNYSDAFSYSGILHFYYLDGFVIGVANSIPGLMEITDAVPVEPSYLELQNPSAETEEARFIAIELVSANTDLPADELRTLGFEFTQSNWRYAIAVMSETEVKNLPISQLSTFSEIHFYSLTVSK